jgi:hypothetical protein
MIKYEDTIDQLLSLRTTDTVTVATTARTGDVDGVAGVRGEERAQLAGLGETPDDAGPTFGRPDKDIDDTGEVLVVEVFVLDLFIDSPLIHSWSDFEI